VAVIKVQQCGRWLRPVFWGVFGWKEMREVLKIAKGRWWN